MSNIHPTAIIYPNVIIGANVTIGAYCIIGAQPENKATWNESNKGVIIEDNTIITGHCTIDAGVSAPTRIDRDCFIMKGVHIGHDCHVQEGVTISPHAVLGGHTVVGQMANLGIGTITHQFSVIGAYSMLGMGTIVTKKSQIWPYGKFCGSPARHMGINKAKAPRMTGMEYYDIQTEWRKQS